MIIYNKIMAENFKLSYVKLERITSNHSNDTLTIYRYTSFNIDYWSTKRDYFQVIFYTFLLRSAFLFTDTVYISRELLEDVMTSDYRTLVARNRVNWLLGDSNEIQPDSTISQRK